MSNDPTKRYIVAIAGLVAVAWVIGFLIGLAVAGGRIPLC